MLRSIHFFSIKPGADEKRMLHLMDNEFAEYAKTFGCIERKTWKLLDSGSPSLSVQSETLTLKWEPTRSAAYMNEGLWPSQKEADAFGNTELPADVKNFLDELFSGIEIENTVRYVDAEG